MLGWLRSLLTRPHKAAEPSGEGSPDSAAPAPYAGPLQLYVEGRVAEARREAEAQLATDPSNAEGLVVQGLYALEQGRLPEALRTLERASALAPTLPDAQIAYGRALSAAGRRPAAKAALQRATELAPERGEPLVQLALMALSSGRADEAMRQLLTAVKLEPGLAEAHFRLGEQLRKQGQFQAAEQHYRRALVGRPTHAAALGSLGAMLKDQGRRDEAGPLLERAAELNPDLAPTAFNLAMLRLEQARWQEAVTLLRSYSAAAPKDADGAYWLGNALMGDGDAAGARKAYDNAIRLNGSYVQARWGRVMASLPAVPASDAEQVSAASEFGIEISRLARWFASRPTVPGHLAVGAQQPYYLAYIPENHVAALSIYGALCSRLMANWNRKVGLPAPVRSVGSKCRVGIVSAHIHSHSVWHALLRGWIEHLDPARFEVHLFHTGPTRDRETEWAARRVSKLHHGAGDWPAWAKAIVDSRPDVLVYPEIGMDATTVRLASLRLARVQLASWGHPVTTGLPTIDGFVSAQALEPPEAEAHYSEKLLVLPRLGCCYTPFGAAPARIDLSTWNIASTDRVLLCAGTPFKYAPRQDSLLVEVARRCRPCKLVFFRAQGGLATLLEQRLRRAFEAAGLRFDDCVRFIPWQSQAAFFGLLDRADVYLDTVGFSGFNSTLQAIERCTPIVAFEGEFMRGRFASGILRQAGLDEWVAGSGPDYLERVERLCAESRLRDRVREQIRAQRASLFDDRESVDELGRRLIDLCA